MKRIATGLLLFWACTPLEPVLVSPGTYTFFCSSCCPSSDRFDTLQLHSDGTFLQSLADSQTSGTWTTKPGRFCLRPWFDRCGVFGQPDTLLNGVCGPTEAPEPLIIINGDANAFYQPVKE